MEHQKELEYNDSQTRLRVAQDLQMNFLVEAAAGTGKTTSIVDRMVNLIASGECEINRLVAVTFTRKAAAELLGRFEAKLRSSAVGADGQFTAAARARMRDACNRSNQAFVGTIHSFCASLLRERPVEFEVDPAFRELTEEVDAQLMALAWHDNIHDLQAEQSPLLHRMSELGIVRSQLRNCYYHLVANRDIKTWPTTEPQPLDLEQTRHAILNYIERMQTLAPNFPVERGNDKLMEHYEEIIRASQRDWSQPAGFIRMLEKFDTTPNTVQAVWVPKAIGKAERDYWEHFRSTIAKPAVAYWYATRYQPVLEFVQRAVALYEKHKRLHGGLDFTDLLLRVVGGLRHQPQLRAYFQTRYTHLLVDEFQDTDPVQAEMLAFLCSQDREQVDWNRCGLRPGSLFLVGDPKQSIYRFRRGDIVTYNRMRNLVVQADGEVVALVKNFRSQASLREWNNQVYREIFGSSATPYSPAAEDMLQGRQDVLQPAHNARTLSGLFKLPVSKLGRSWDIAGEADRIARTIRHAIDCGLELHRTQAESAQGRTTAAEPRDFLIIPPNRNNIPIYKAALDRYNLPCDVTGGNAVAELAELQLLIQVLQSVDDPYDRIAFLALLRHQLFGFNDQELYQLRQLGVTFVYSAPLNSATDKVDKVDKVDVVEVVDGVEVVARYRDACHRLSAYARWLRNMPYAVGVARIAEHLGLLAQASAREDGNVAVGGFLKAIEWLRQRANAFDSIMDVVGSLDELMTKREFEGCSALSPNANVVRVMNLHKAKGLEAPIVFLVDVNSPKTHAVHSHVNRSGQSDSDRALGYLSVQHEINNPPRPKYYKPIACPAGWESFQAEEQRYLDAERDRLLYVATTRVGSALIVSTGNDHSTWAKLYPFMNDAPELPVPAPSRDSAEHRPTSTAQPQRVVDKLLDAQQMSLAGHSALDAQVVLEEKVVLDEQGMEPEVATSAMIAERWESSRNKSYDIQSSKVVALRGVSRPRWETTGEYGYRWGSAVHELLEISTKSPGAPLRPFALELAHEHGIAHDRLDELLSTVQSVMLSQVWHRAQGAARCYSELPLEALTTNSDGLPTILRGVIDLIFEELATPHSAAGWVIVDYKTDDITATDVPAAIKYYSSQLRQYAQHWSATTGNPTKELGLYFTKLNRYEAIA